jgi:hypothetical protein
MMRNGLEDFAAGNDDDGNPRSDDEDSGGGAFHDEGDLSPYHHDSDSSSSDGDDLPMFFGLPPLDQVQEQTQMQQQLQPQKQHQKQIQHPHGLVSSTNNNSHSRGGNVHNSPSRNNLSPNSFGTISMEGNGNPLLEDETEADDSLRSLRSPAVASIRRDLRDGSDELLQESNTRNMKGDGNINGNWNRNRNHPINNSGSPANINVGLNQEGQVADHVQQHQPLHEHQATGGPKPHGGQVGSFPLSDDQISPRNQICADTDEFTRLESNLQAIESMNNEDPTLHNWQQEPRRQTAAPPLRNHQPPSRSRLAVAQPHDAADLIELLDDNDGVDVIVVEGEGEVGESGGGGDNINKIDNYQNQTRNNAQPVLSGVNRPPPPPPANAGGGVGYRNRPSVAGRPIKRPRPQGSSNFAGSSGFAAHPPFPPSSSSSPQPRSSSSYSSSASMSRAPHGSQAAAIAQMYARKAANPNVYKSQPHRYLPFPPGHRVTWEAPLRAHPVPPAAMRSNEPKAFELSLLNVSEFTITGLPVTFDGRPSSVLGFRKIIKDVSRGHGRAVFERDKDPNNIEETNRVVGDGGKWRVPLGAYRAFYAYLRSDPNCRVTGIPEEQLKIASMGKARLEKGFPSVKKMIALGMPEGLARTLAPFQRGGVDFVVEKEGRALIADGEYRCCYRDVC